jgi:hypothetical protein
MVGVTQIVCVNDVSHLFNPEGAAVQQYRGAILGLELGMGDLIIKYGVDPRTDVSASDVDMSPLE